ncbi:stage III sporulation protein SpoIIIAB [Herbivorax sp. ANBcel31]|uniref:stage III sporulation protein SpoIIIAB n=1 Tax=Herbivorax sp. ANBcel31 TaxID=3069754 RepID=UPI0027B13726|nr:stage III sporulation protein SpoIIIAB [Herbivorax sp. ANBcel31]MDQ2085300.1 stage III sporulation protein SpoIIIAB [Herbivorax sp. ANBcel31]
MAVKILGCLIVFISSSLLGHIYSRKCSKRPNELRTLQAMLQMFENEISFLSNKLSDAFYKIYNGNESTVSNFFKSTVKNLCKEPGISASKAWKSAVESNIKNTSLDKEDEQIIISFGKMLGTSDLEGQIKNIRMTLNQLKLQEEKAEEFRKKNEAMYRNLGILGGLAIIIILF